MVHYTTVEIEDRYEPIKSPDLIKRTINIILSTENENDITTTTMINNFDWRSDLSDYDGCLLKIG
ncbi:hypothetical protein BY996DRAFT_6560079 [Phakopsora pachyrhizi]|nr:hypothetical protein BY996DRAFT_6560079 [Phakopsora pachyrhizi]